MKTVYKMGIGMVLSVVILVLVVGSLINDITSGVQKEKNKYEVYIGQKHIVDGDTLTITDYSILDETFTLSDGTKVAFSLIHKK